MKFHISMLIVFLIITLLSLLINSYVAPTFYSFKSTYSAGGPFSSCLFTWATTVHCFLMSPENETA